MRILVAEDEEAIATVYQMGLRSNGHEVTITTNGLECLNEYQTRHDRIGNYTGLPFDAVILDYRMPGLDGFETAKRILAIEPKQRIIFASAYARDLLDMLIRKTGMVAELVQKPFDLDTLLDIVEDTYVFSKLQELNINVGDIRKWNPSHSQLSDLLDAMLRLKDPKTVFPAILQSKSAKHASDSRTGSVKDKHRNEDEKGITAAEEIVQHHPQERNENSEKITLLIVEDSLSFLGPEWLSIFYYHLNNLGITKDSMLEHPEEFAEALDKIFGAASGLVKDRILEGLNRVNKGAGKSSLLFSAFRNAILVSKEKAQNSGKLGAAKRIA